MLDLWYIFCEAFCQIAKIPQMLPKSPIEITMFLILFKLQEPLVVKLEFPFPGIVQNLQQLPKKLWINYKKTKKRRDADNEHDDIRVPIVQLMSESNKCRSCSKTEFYFTERCPK